MTGGVRLLRTVVRGALSLAAAIAAVWCLYRGMRHLFGFETPRGASQVASLSGVGPALGYFVAGVLCLLVAGELYPKSYTPVPPERDAQDAGA